MREIIFTARGSSSQIGNFAPGERMAVDESIAAHLVDEARCARYAEQPASVAAEPASEPAPEVVEEPKPKRKK